MKRTAFEKAISRDYDDEEKVLRVNPEIYEQAKGMMTQEQIDEYKQMGEEMYNTIDFSTSEVLNNPSDPLLESVAYISEGIKSGMHPSFLDEDELKVMCEWSGDKWYEKFGYDSLDY